MDIALDPTTGDLAFTETGDLDSVDALACIAQQIAIRLRFFKGEWFLNQNEGTPWMQRILGKKPNSRRVLNTIRKVISTTPYVLDVIDLEMTFTADKRSAAISFKAVTSYGLLDSRAFDLNGLFVIGF